MKVQHPLMDIVDISHAQLCRDRLHHLKPSIAKASKQENASFCNRVEDIAKFLIVKQQIDELSNFEIIDGDDWFTITSDDQSILCGSFELYILCRNAINGALIQAGSCEVRFD